MESVRARFEREFREVAFNYLSFSPDELTTEDEMLAKEMFVAGMYVVLEGNLDGLREFLGSVK